MELMTKYYEGALIDFDNIQVDESKELLKSKPKDDT